MGGWGVGGRRYGLIFSTASKLVFLTQICKNTRVFELKRLLALCCVRVVCGGVHVPVWCTFPSVNQMVEHRRALHKWTRCKLDDDYEAGIVTDASSEPVRILSLIDGEKYSVLFESGTASFDF